MRRRWEAHLQAEGAADTGILGRVHKDVELQRLRDVKAPILEVVVQREQLLRLDVEPPIYTASA